MFNLRLFSVGLIFLISIAGSITGLVKSVLQPAVAAQPTLVDSDPWNPIRNVLERIVEHPRKRGTDKGPFDLISPGIWVSQSAVSGSPVQIWHAQPMLIWQSDGVAASRPDQVEVVQLDTLKVVWSQNVAVDRYFAQAIATQLQAGQRYQIRFLKRDTVTQKMVVVIRPIAIQMLSAQEHRSIEEQLNRAEVTAKTNRATAIELTQKRIEVFVQNGLWSDALQALNSADLPPDARQTLTQEVVKRWGQRLN